MCILNMQTIHKHKSMSVHVCTPKRKQNLMAKMFHKFVPVCLRILICYSLSWAHNLVKTKPIVAAKSEASFCVLELLTAWIYACCPCVCYEQKSCLDKTGKCCCGDWRCTLRTARYLHLFLQHSVTEYTNSVHATNESVWHAIQMFLSAINSRSWS